MPNITDEKRIELSQIIQGEDFITFWQGVMEKMQGEPPKMHSYKCTRGHWIIGVEEFNRCLVCGSPLRKPGGSLSRNEMLGFQVVEAYGLRRRRWIEHKHALKRKKIREEERSLKYQE